MPFPSPGSGSLHCAPSLSCVCLFVNPWTAASQVPPSMGFSRQGSWSGLPFPSLEDLPVPRIEPTSPTLAKSEGLGHGYLFFLLGSKITADGDCSHEIKRMLAPWKKSYDQPKQHVEKQRHLLADKVCVVKAMVFPLVMYGCENWTVKKAEC